MRLTEWLASSEKFYPVLLGFAASLTAFAAILTIGGHVPWQYWLLAVFGYFLYGCLGITVTHHRLLAHRSFKTYRTVEYIGSTLAALGGTGSGVGWVAIHREHHKHADTDRDPHSPHRGLLGIRVTPETFTFNQWRVRDLVTDPFHLFVHKWYYAIFFGYSAAVWLLLGTKAWLFFHPVAAFMVFMASAASVLLGHGRPGWFAYRRYDTPDTSVNSWINALIAWGDGWHNNHHRFPGSPHFGRAWWEIDIGGTLAGALTVSRPR